MNDTPPSDSDEGENFSPPSYKEEINLAVRQETTPRKGQQSSASQLRQNPYSPGVFDNVKLDFHHKNVPFIQKTNIKWENK